MQEARQSVISTYLDGTDADRDDLQSDNQAVNLVDITEPDQWVDLTAKVVELWEPRSDSIDQVGLLGDETGTIKFTAWAKSDLPELHQGQVYRLGNVVTDEYQGRYSVKLNRTTTVEEVDIEMALLWRRLLVSHSAVSRIVLSASLPGFLKMSRRS
jgi:replication factor A1